MHIESTKSLTCFSEIDSSFYTQSTFWILSGERTTIYKMWSDFQHRSG